MDIGEVSRRSGIPASTLRFYEEKGLIASGGRRGLRRLFDSGVLDRLALIALGSAAGFSLNAMRDGLRHAAVCPAPSHLECPTFRRLLRAAASSRKRKTS